MILCQYWTEKLLNHLMSQLLLIIGFLFSSLKEMDTCSFLMDIILRKRISQKRRTMDKTHYLISTFTDQCFLHSLIMNGILIWLENDDLYIHKFCFLK